MIIIDSVISSLRDVIARGITDSMASVKLSYEKAVIPNPLRRTYIVLNPTKVKITPYHDSMGFLTKTAELTVAIEIHRAEASDPNRLLEIFSEILTVLYDDGTFGIEESGCSEIKSSANTASVYLPCYVKFSVRF